MSRQTRANRKTSPIDCWEEELNSVSSDIRGQPVSADDGIYAKVSLHCPLGGRSRIEIPVRAQNCTHLQCFDLATFLKMHDRNFLAVKRHGKKLLGVDASVDNKHVSWDCPICKEKAEVRDLHIDGYFESLLQEYKDLQTVEEVKIMSDGSHCPIVEPKNADEEEISADAMEITDMSLEEIRRLPETHQLCKAVKRRLLNKYMSVEKKKATKESSSNAASTTSTLVEETADDARLSSGDVVEPAQKLQTQAEQLRRAPAAADHASLVLHAQNEQLQADSSARSPFCCDICGKQCTSLRARRDHKRAVHGEQRFACTVEGCSYTSAHNSNLLRHMRNHSDEKPFECEDAECGKAFAQRGDLLRHTRDVHELSRKFPCRLCPHSSSSASHLNRHVKAVHDKRHARSHGTHTYSCAKCDKQFRRKDSLRMHEEVHGEKLRCDFCEYETPHSSKLKQHVLEMHKDERQTTQPPCSTPDGEVTASKDDISVKNEPDLRPIEATVV